MKKLKYILLVLGAMSVASCESWLDEDPQYTVNTKVQFSDEANANQALLACYGYLTADNCFGQMIQAIELAYTGMGWSQTNGTANDRTSSLNADNTQVETSYAWSGLYKAIGETNAFIVNIQDSPLDEAVKKRMEGEARFIRGLCYYELTMYWGDVPLKTSPSAAEGVEIARSPRSEVFEQIRQDWEFAATYTREDQKDGFISKMGAKAYLGKLYHTLACLGDESAWTKAKTYFDEVYGRYALEKFPSLFVITGVKNSKESIFQLNFKATGLLTRNRGSWLTAPTASTNGQSFSTLRASKYWYDYCQATYPGDPRIEETFLTKWRNYAGVGLGLKPLVEPVVTPRDSSYAYPYFTYTIEGEAKPAGWKNQKMYVGVIPYDKVANPASPTVEELKVVWGGVDKPAAGYPAGLKAYVDNLTTKPATNVIGGWPYFKKVLDPTQEGNNSHKNLILYRYADALLMMADVYNELGDKAKATNLVDEVLMRARASRADGKPSKEPAKWSDALTKEQMREKIFFERLIESYGEPEVYARMRIRGTEFLKKVLELNNNHGIAKASVANNPNRNGNWGERIFNNGNLSDQDFLKKNLLLSIPQSEFNANLGIGSNNFGYQ